MECNRDEAKRAKEIAERKYCSKDITGAKKFALKAQSLYPDLDGISQFLATLDVYAAAENKINGESDLYGILGVSPLADDDTVKKHYRKLALSLHPDKNKSVGAEGAFQFVSEAWTVLSDKEKRSVYDRKTNVTMQKFHAQNRVPKPPTNNGFHKFTTAQTRVKSTKAKGSTNSPKDSSTKLETFLGRTGTGMGRTQTGTGGSKTAGAGPTTTGSKDNITATAKTETAKSETCHAGTGSGPVKTGPKKPGAGPTKAAPAGVRSSSNKQMTPKTFWTVCKRCKLQYEFLRKYLNQALLCPTCLGPFHATETAPPNTSGSSESAKGSNKNRPNPETCETSVVDPAGQFSSMNGLGGVKRDREEAGIGEEALRRKISKVTSETKPDNHENNKRAPSEVKKDVVNPRIIKDGLIKKATMEIKKKLNEWNSETVCGNSLVADLAGGTKPLVTNDVPDADFHDFDRDRRRKCFAEGQLWGGYDEHDGMPRLYAMVKKVISLKPFRMKVRWFDPKPDDKNLGVVSRFLKTAAFGEFKPGKHEIVSTPNYFSHKANFKKQAAGTIYVFPRKGDVCALYRNYQTSDSDLAESNYEIVEVDDYDEETGATVTPLIKVSGLKTVFHRHLDAKETRVVEKNEMFMFSHQIPSFLLTGKEAERSPKGCVELDPAAVPPQFLQLNGEAAVEDDEMLELGKGTAGADGKIFIID